MLQPTQRRDGVTSVDRTVSCNATVWIVTVVLVLAAVPASPARAQQPTPPPQAEAIGKVIDKEMHRIRAAVASGDEEKVRACLKRLFPALAEQKQATIQPYVDAARGQQVRGGKKGLLWSLMQTCGYSGYVSDGLNLMTLGNIGAIDGTLDGTLGHLGNLGLLLSMYDCYDKASRGKLDDNTRTATMLAVYAKIASHYLKRYGNAFGAAAMTGYNLGMWARTWQLSSSQAKLMEGLNDYWHDRARQLGGWRTMWTDMWDRGGTAEVMKQLQQAGYWNEVDATKIYTGWSQQTWNGNYKAIFGERYFNKYVAKILANHVRRLAEKERGEAIEKIQRFIREFPQRELTIVTTLRVVDDAGNRSPVDAERVVVGLYCQNRKLLDLPYGTQQISVKTNLRAYSQAIAKAAGDFQVVAFYRCRNDSPRVAPDALTVGDLDYDEATGLCRALSDPWGFCFWSRLRFSSKGVAAEPFRVGRGGDRLSGFGNYAWLGPIRFNVFILPVQIRVVTAKGQPAADVSLTGPCGSATTDKQGRAQLMVTAASQSLVGVKHNGKATGDWVILTPAEVFKDPQAVHTIKLSDDPPVPKLDKYGSAQARRQAKDTAAAFAAGKVTFGSASKRLQRSGRLAEAAQANATNTWGVYEVVQLARINRRYEPKPDMSAQARATAAQAKRKAIEKLKARRESYLQPFADLEQQQEQASSKLAIQAMKRDKSIRRIMDDGRAAAKPVREVTARAGTRMKRLDSLLTMSYQRTEPRSFETLAEVQNYRKGVQALRTEIEPMTGQLGEDRRQLDRRLTALTNTLGSIVDPMEQGVGLVDVWAFRAEMGLLLAGAQGVLRAIAGELDSGKPDMAALGLRIADERLGGVQIQAAKNQKLMKAYDALLDAAPLRLRNNARRTRNLKALVGAFDEINKAIAFARSRGRWSYHLQIASGQEKQAWRQAGHNGFGVEAHSRWLEAEAIWKRLVTMQQILRQQRKIEAWLKDLDAKRETMARRRAAMRKSGWFIAEIDDALARRQRRPQQANALAELLRQARQIEKTRAGFSKIQADSVLHGAIQKFSFDDLLAASTTYGKAMAAAVAAARQGDRAKALAARRDAEKAIAAFTYQRGIGFDVGGRYATATLGTDWELVCTRQALDDRDTLAGLLATLKADNRARLTITAQAPQGVDVSKLTIRLLDATGAEAAATVTGSPARGLVYLLDPQSVTVEAAMPGAKVTPASSKLTRRAKGAQTLRLRVEPTLAGGKASSGSTGGQGQGAGHSGGHTQEPGTVEDMSVTATMLCKTTFDDGQPPRWSADSKTILLPNFERVTLATGKTDRLDVRSAVNPHILGRQVVYRTNVGGDWLMTVPLAGGQADRLCRTRRRSPTNRIVMTLLDVRAGSPPMFLFLRHVPVGWMGRATAKTGLWAAAGPIPDVEEGQWIGMLPEGTRTAIVSDNWLRVAVGNWTPGERRGADWVIYHAPEAEKPCQPVARMQPAAGVRTLDFTPNGAYVITVQSNPGESFQTLAIRPVKSIATQTVVARGAITYGRPGWSRDGRFVALRAFGQPGSRASQLMVLQIVGDPYAFTTTTINALAAAGGVGGQGGGHDAGDNAGGNRRDTDDHDAPPPKPSDAVKQAEAEVTEAYNRLTSLMAAGKGDTPEAREAYKEYKEARARYDKLTQGQ